MVLLRSNEFRACDRIKAKKDFLALLKFDCCTIKANLVTASPGKTTSNAK